MRYRHKNAPGNAFVVRGIGPAMPALLPHLLNPLRETPEKVQKLIYAGAEKLNHLLRPCELLGHPALIRYTGHENPPSV